MNRGSTVLGAQNKVVRPWMFAGIMLSYWCNARCPFCYVSCGPDAKDWVEPAEAVRWWQELDELARSLGKAVKVHLSGGEPFGNWPVLHEVAALAHKKGLTGGGGFQKVETNGYWATDAGIVRERVAELDRLGMQKLSVSADPFHQQFVSPDLVRTCVEAARQVLGPERVQVRWLDWYEDMQDLRNMPRGRRDEAFREALGRHRERLGGRAARQVAGLLDARAADAFAPDVCGQAILGAKHIHIDPYGNVFPGTCAGVLLGSARGRSLREIWEEVTERSCTNPVLSALIEGGPYVLVRYAKMLGFQPRATGYAGKCHLCTDVREFLFESKVFENRLGPAECYRAAHGESDGERDGAEG